MAEGNEHSGSSFGGGREYGHGGRGGHGGYRGNGGRGFRRDGEHGGNRRDGERGGFRRDGGHGGRDGFRGHDRGGYKPRFHRDGDRNFRDRDFHDHDGEQMTRDSGHETGRGDRRDFHNDRRDGNRDFRRGGNPRYNGNGRFGQDDRRDNRHAERRDDHRDFNRDGRRDDRGPRRDYDRNDRSRGHVDEQGEFHENRRGGAHWDKARRNSDGTISFPSQNPYTDPRPGEPKMPKGMEWYMLSKDEKERLRGLSKEHAENIGLHMLAAYSLEESDPALALEHAKWIAHQASRIDMARETLAFIAYRQGNYKLALREFRTAFRMNGYLDYLPFIADCERGTGNPKKAVEVATGDEAKQLRGESKAEMFLVYAGALSDLGMWAKAAEIAGTVARAKGLSGEYRMRAVQAEQYFLEQDGRPDDAAKLDTLLDKLEEAYAEVDEDDENAEDVVIDYDLADFSDDQLDKLGISEDEAQYAPDDDDEDGSESEDEGDSDSEDDPESNGDEGGPDNDEVAASDGSDDSDGSDGANDSDSAAAASESDGDEDGSASSESDAE
ncbi:tetratricopeptide repeat protein [Bifidobacterium sp. UBA744]|uniref:tetratricopeptide repeat protein n=1 Tax=Bifidobacterium sp. UBA744 TaxID=1946112 RepID=UPI0025C26394|nr:hypothetical protein [Bifidobacterium sp. UBA744]